MIVAMVSWAPRPDDRSASSAASARSGKRWLEPSGPTGVDAIRRGQRSEITLEEVLTEECELRHHAHDTAVVGRGDAHVAAKRAEELDRIIAEESLDPAATRAFVDAAFRDGAVQPTGTGITKTIPPVSRFGQDGGHATKKQTVLTKLGDFFDRFFNLS